MPSLALSATWVTEVRLEAGSLPALKVPDLSESAMGRAIKEEMSLAGPGIFQLD